MNYTDLGSRTADLAFEAISEGMDAMEDYISETVAGAEEGRKALNKVNKVAQKAKELSDDLKRKVTVEELSKESGMSVKSILEAMRLCGYTIEEIERP